MTSHYDYLIAKSNALLATSRMSPEARARAMGTKLYQSVAKTHTITVDCAKPEERKVESSVPAAPMPPPPPPPPPKDTQTVAQEKFEASIRGGARDVLNAVVEAWGGVTIGVLIGPDRHKTATLPRFAAARLMKLHLNMRPRDMSRALGKRDRTTLTSALKQAEILFADDADWAERYHHALRLLGASQ